MFALFKKLCLFTLTWLARALEWYCEKRGQVIHIKGRPGTPEAEDIYLVRYYLLPQGCPWNIYIHRFLRSDHDVPHDHPFDFVGLVLQGGYKEKWYRRCRSRADGNFFQEEYSYNPPGSFIVRQASHTHQVLLDRKYDYEERKQAPLTVIVRTPRYQDWGFWRTINGPYAGMVEAEWVQWQEYLGMQGEEYDEERA